MPYSLVPLVRTQRRSRSTRRPLGFDEGVESFVVLDPGDTTQAESGVCLAYSALALGSPKASKVAEAPPEALGPAAKALFSARLRREMAGPLHDQIAAYLGPRLRPELSGRRVLWLGPGARGTNIFWSEAGRPQKHSKTFSDSFTRSAALGGSSLSGGTGTWTNTDGNFSTNGSQVTTATLGAFDGGVALLSVEPDTDDCYAQIDVVSYQSTGGDYYTSSTYLRNDGGGFGTVGLYFGRAYNGTGLDVHVKAQSIDTDLDTDTLASTDLPGTYRVVSNGSSISCYRDGVLILSGTDTTEPTGAGNRQILFDCFMDGAGNTPNSMVFDNFIGGDITEHRVHFFPLLGVA